MTEQEIIDLFKQEEQELRKKISELPFDPDNGFLRAEFGTPPCFAVWDYSTKGWSHIETTKVAANECWYKVSKMLGRGQGERWIIQIPKDKQESLPE